MLFAGPAGGLLLPGFDIARHVGDASQVALLAVTLGMESERTLRRIAALSATDGLLLDTLASSMAEQAAAVLHRRVVAWAAERGLSAGARFSPGYGDLPLSVQPTFLEASGASRALGISVTPANLLIPTKSVTAIVPLRTSG